MNEGHKRSGQLVITSGHPPMALQRAKEVFHPMPAPIVTFVKGAFFLSPRRRRQAWPDIPFAKSHPQRVGIVSFVAHHGRTLSGINLLEQFRRLDRVGHITGAQSENDGTPVSIDDRVHLGSEPATTWSHRLRALASSGIGSAVMDTHISRIHTKHRPTTLLGQGLEDRKPETALTPLRKVSVNSSPMCAGARQIPPRTSGSQQIQQGDHDAFQVRWRPTTNFLPIPVFTRLWQLYAGKASAHPLCVCG